jgi:hypothetical protein
MSDTTTVQPLTQEEVFVNMIVAAWQSQNKKLNDLLANLSDEQWAKDTAPGRNSGTYLLGHLTAVNDHMLLLLGFCDRLYPELENIFLKNPDKSGLAQPSVAELKRYWNEINEKLNSHMVTMQPADWFQKHSLVSAEDFAKEPHRNKLNILVNRTSHQSYHLGQLAYLA